MPIGDDAARRCDDGRKSQKVGGFHGGFGNDIGKSRGEQAVGVAVTAIDDRATPSAQAMKRRFLMRQKHVGAGGVQDGIGKDGFVMSANGCAIVLAGKGVTAVPAFLGDGAINDAIEGKTLMNDCQQKAKQGLATDIRQCAIQRITHKKPRGMFVVRRFFLADDAAMGGVFFNDIAQMAFNGGVNGGDGCAIGFVLHAMGVAKIVGEDASGIIGEAMGELSQRGGQRR